MYQHELLIKCILICKSLKEIKCALPVSSYRPRLLISNCIKVQIYRCIIIENDKSLISLNIRAVKKIYLTLQSAANITNIVREKPQPEVGGNMKEAKRRWSKFWKRRKKLFWWVISTENSRPSSIFTFLHCVCHLCI